MTEKRIAEKGKTRKAQSAAKKTKAWEHRQLIHINKELKTIGDLVVVIRDMMASGGSRNRF